MARNRKHAWQERHAMQDKAPSGSRKRGAAEAEEDDLPGDVRKRLSAIKGADLG